MYFTVGIDVGKKSLNLLFHRNQFPLKKVMYLYWGDFVVGSMSKVESVTIVRPKLFGGG